MTTGTPDIYDALNFCNKMHEGQTDKNGVRFALHPQRVAMYLDVVGQFVPALAEVPVTKEMRIAALLHDTIEDTEATFDLLKHLGYTEHTIYLVRGVTRAPDESYEEFIERSISFGMEVIKLKCSDIFDNSDPRRATSKYDSMEKRYRKAWKRLTGQDMLPMIR